MFRNIGDLQAPFSVVFFLLRTKKATLWSPGYKSSRRGACILMDSKKTQGSNQCNWRACSRYQTVLVGMRSSPLSQKTSLVVLVDWTFKKQENYATPWFSLLSQAELMLCRARGWVSLCVRRPQADTQGTCASRSKWENRSVFYLLRQIWHHQQRSPEILQNSHHNG